MRDRRFPGFPWGKAFRILVVWPAVAVAGIIAYFYLAAQAASAGPVASVVVVGIILILWELSRIREVGEAQASRELSKRWDQEYDVEFCKGVNRLGAEERAVKLWRQPRVGEPIVEEDGTISVKVEFPDKTEKHTFPAGTNRYRIGDFVSELRQQYEENPEATPILVEAPNGEIVVFRAGTDPEWIGDWMQKWRGGFTNYFPEVLKTQRERPSCPELEALARMYEKNAEDWRQAIAKKGSATDEERRHLASHEESAARIRRQIEGAPEPDRS
jgi:hypothetical protein